MARWHATQRARANMGILWVVFIYARLLLNHQLHITFDLSNNIPTLKVGLDLAKVYVFKTFGEVKTK